MSIPTQAGYVPLSRRSYITAAAYDTNFFLYDPKNTPHLLPVLGATAGTCPAGRILKETGRKLFPGVNRGVISPMVAVYDEKY